jgi:purine nucleoside phosphorylase
MTAREAAVGILATMAIGAVLALAINAAGWVSPVSVGHVVVTAAIIRCVWIIWRPAR